MNLRHLIENPSVEQTSTLLSAHALLSSKAEIPRFFIPAHSIPLQLEERYLSNCIFSDLDEIYTQTMELIPSLETDEDRDELIDDIEGSLTKIYGRGKIHYERARLTPFCLDESHSFVVNTRIKAILQKRSTESRNYMNSYKEWCVIPSVTISPLQDRVISIALKSWRLYWSHQENYMEENIVRSILHD